MTRSTAEVVWWAARDGAAHAAPTGTATAFCGAADLRVRVGRGRPCQRCLDAATAWVTGTAPTVTAVEGNRTTPITFTRR